MKYIPITCRVCGTTSPAPLTLWTQITEDIEIKTYETCCPVCGKTLTETRKEYITTSTIILNRKVAVKEAK
jgi:hypothetical protein